MRQQLLDDLKPLLMRDYRFKERGDWLREGKCPQCAKSELFTKAEDPWVLRCGRLNKCGWEGHVKDLYPEIFESWSDRYKSSDKDPTAAADAYLMYARGLSITGMRGAYTQDTFYSRDLNAGTATVRFALPGGSWWERLIDKPGRFGKMKARFAPGRSYAGQWWTPPGVTLEQLAEAKELWLPEGIFDAWSLHEHELATAGLLSCNNYPAEALSELRKVIAARPDGGRGPKLIFALDSDAAGKRYIRQWVARARAEGWDAGAAQIPQPPKGKVDWNDLHQRERLQPEHLEEYLWRGDLLLAASASAKAILMHSRHGWGSFPMEFERQLYWATFNAAAIEQAVETLAKQQPGLNAEELRAEAIKQCAQVYPIANCAPRALYFQQDPLTEESWYYFKVDFPHDGPSVKNTFTSSHLGSAAEFKKRLMAIAPGGMFTGSTGQLDRFLETQIRRVPVVQTVGFLGYSREHSAYVFTDHAVRGGRLFPLNDEDFFDFGALNLKSLNRSVDLDIAQADTPDLHWVDLVWRAFGPKGIVAAAAWFGGFYAEQLRAAHKSFFFFEFWGEPNGGKSTLVEFLWKLAGRADYEGFDPAKSTAAARARNLAQVANLPVVFIESDREEDRAHARAFDWEEMKTAYNGRTVRSRGVKSNGNETYEPPFRGALVAVQNSQVNASEAVLTRFCSLEFNRKDFTPETKAAAEELERIGVEQVSNFVLHAAMAEARVMAKVQERFPVHEKALQGRPDIHHPRVVKCHAQLLALVEAFGSFVNLHEDRLAQAVALVPQMAAARQLAINADHPIVQQFWDLYDFLTADDEPTGPDDAGNPKPLNHHRDENLIAINMPQFIERAAGRRQQLPPITDLQKHLRTSKVRKFIDVRCVNSSWAGKAVKCWVFQRETTPQQKARRS